MLNYRPVNVLAFNDMLGGYFLVIDILFRDDRKAYLHILDALQFVLYIKLPKSTEPPIILLHLHYRPICDKSKALKADCDGLSSDSLYIEPWTKALIKTKRSK